MSVEVYILYSEILGKYYVGQTNDLERRLKEHNRSQTRFTRTGHPWKLVKTFPCKDRSESVRLENRIKKRGIARYLTEG